MVIFHSYVSLQEGNLFTDHLRLFCTLELHSIPTPIGSLLQNPRSSKGIEGKLLYISIVQEPIVTIKTV